MLTLASAGKTTVEITNTLEGKQKLNIHCKSKDDDLGPHWFKIPMEFWTSLVQDNTLLLFLSMGKWSFVTF